MYASSKDRDKSIALSLSLSLSPSSTSSKPGRKCDGRSIKETSSEEVILSSPISAASSTSGLKRRSEDLKLDLDETQNQTPKRQRPRASPNKAPVKTAPSPSTPRFLNSVTDDMIRNPENYEGVPSGCKNWDIIRPFFLKFKVPDEVSCDTVRMYITHLGASELQLVVNGIDNPNEHQPCNKLLKMKTNNKVAALKCFTRIIHGHSEVSHIRTCEENVICINLLHWSSALSVDVDAEEKKKNCENSNLLTPSLSTYLRKPPLDSISDDMFRNPENYEGVHTKCKNWEIIRPFFARFIIPADIECKTIRQYIHALGASDLQLIMNGILNPNEHQPCNKLLKIKSGMKISALRCFTKIIYGHSVITQIQTCKDDPVCINLLHWSSTLFSEVVRENNITNVERLNNFYHVNRRVDNKKPVSTTTLLAPSLAVRSKGLAFTAITDDMIRNPEKYENVSNTCKNWEIIRPFFVKYKIPDALSCNVIRVHISELGAEELKLVINGIANPNEHQPCNKLLKLKTKTKVAALNCFTRIIHGHRGLTHLQMCTDDPSCINLLHWNSTVIAKIDVLDHKRKNLITSSPFLPADEDGKGLPVTSDDKSVHVENMEDKSMSHLAEITFDRLQYVKIRGYTFKKRNVYKHTMCFVCKECLSIYHSFHDFSTANNCQVELPALGHIRFDFTTNKFFGNPLAPDGEMHACENPKYKTRVPVIIKQYDNHVVPGTDAPLEFEHDEIVNAVMLFIPIINDEYGGILYFITRLTIVNGEYTVTSKDGYIGWTSFDEITEQPLYKRFESHLSNEQRQEKISGDGELHIIECFRGTASQAEHLEYLCLKNKSFLKPAGTILINTATGRCIKKNIQALGSPSHELHKTLITGFNQMIKHGVKYGSKLAASAIGN